MSSLKFDFVTWCSYHVQKNMLVGNWKDAMCSLSAIPFSNFSGEKMGGVSFMDRHNKILIWLSSNV